MAARVDEFIRWGNFTDERFHVLRQGEDFDREPSLVRQAAQMWASRNGYRCNVELGPSRVTFRFVPKGD
jgi:hypothetical protein